MSTAQADHRAVRSLIAPSVATLAALAILLALGWWQLERKAWKEGLLAQIAARAHGEPGAVLPEASWPNFRPADEEYRRVRLSGAWDTRRMVALHGLAELRERQATQGFYLFVPLRLPDDAVVMINRGFVPTELRAGAEAALREAPAQGSVTGLVRAPEIRGWFLPENDLSRDSWWVRDPEQMGRARSLARVAPFYVDADATPNPSGWPRGGQTQLALRNSHLQYAVTWFGLAATLVGVYAAFAWGRLRPRA